MNRKLFKVQVHTDPISVKQREVIQKQLLKQGIAKEDLRYFYMEQVVQNQAYNTKVGKIMINNKKGELKDLADASDQLNVMALSTPVVKYLVAFPKQIKLVGTY